ncbi:MAG: M28 family peptidase [Armatimonadaceae bacterium]
MPGLSFYRFAGKTGLLSTLCLTLILAQGVFVWGQEQKTMSQEPPSAVKSAETPQFDAKRAFADLERQVKFGPRVPGTRGHTECQDWMVEELKKSCGNANRQTFRALLSRTRTEPRIELRLTNVYAAINPEAKKQVLLCAHWDTRPTADMEEDPKKANQPIPGANDGASGVAVLLEVARLFAAKKPEVGVQFVFFDGEDYGPHDDRMYLGAKWYARKPALPKPDYAILVDMVGDKNLGIPRELRSEAMAREINDKVWNAAKELGIKQFLPTKGHLVNGYLEEIWDDHLPLQEAGWKAIDLIDFDYPYWHTLEDTPDKCSPESLKAVGDVLAKVIYDEKNS